MERFRLLGSLVIDTTEANAELEDTSRRAQNTEGKRPGAFSKIGLAALKIGKAAVTAGAALGGAWIATGRGYPVLHAKMSDRLNHVIKRKFHFERR